MLKWLTKDDDDDAISLLKKDHDKVKELFDRFEAAKSQPAKTKIVKQALTELKIHAALEEELFSSLTAEQVEHLREGLMQLLVSAQAHESHPLSRRARSKQPREKTTLRQNARSRVDGG